MAFEVWLRPNRRPAMVVMCAALAVAFVFLGTIATAVWRDGEGGTLTTGGVVAACVAAITGVAAVLAYYSGRRPRVCRQGSQVVFRIADRRRTLAVPIEVVEAFFLGQGPAHLPGGFGTKLETVNLVARLSQRATEWHQRDTDPRLGTWCGGYITIRGTCCEPLTTEVVHRLNRLLSSARREATRND